MRKKAKRNSGVTSTGPPLLELDVDEDPPPLNVTKT